MLNEEKETSANSKPYLKILLSSENLFSEPQKKRDRTQSMWSKLWGSQYRHLPPNQQVNCLITKCFPFFFCSFLYFLLTSSWSVRSNLAGITKKKKEKPSGQLQPCNPSDIITNLLDPLRSADKHPPILLWCNNPFIHANIPTHPHSNPHHASPSLFLLNGSNRKKKVHTGKPLFLYRSLHSPVLFLFFFLSLFF